MKLIHLADLHIGKRLCGYSLLEDQAYVFEEIVKGVKDYDPDAILIAGDVFDRSVPSEEAIRLYDKFISRLSKNAPIYMVAGNHDSGTRLELYKTFLKEKNIFIAGKAKEEVERFELNTKDERAHIYLLPYLSPGSARETFNDDFKSFESAVSRALTSVKLDPEAINILVSHQFFLNSRTDSESLPEGSERTVVGGLDDIRTEILPAFDYVALGHIHRMASLGSERIRYAGAPLKYSVNESEKYLNRVNLTKERIKVEPLPLSYLRDVREIRGNFDELISEDLKTEDYVSIRLESKSGHSDVKKRLLKFYPNLLNIVFEEREKKSVEKLNSNRIREEAPIELLERFFEDKGFVLDKRQRRLSEKILEKLENETT